MDIDQMALIDGLSDANLNAVIDDLKHPEMISMSAVYFAGTDTSHRFLAMQEPMRRKNITSEKVLAYCLKARAARDEAISFNADAVKETGA